MIYSEAANVHQGMGDAKFVAMPMQILPSVQINMRAGQMPPPEDNGVTYLKIPPNAV